MRGAATIWVGGGGGGGRAAGAVVTSRLHKGQRLERANHSSKQSLW